MELLLVAAWPRCAFASSPRLNNLRLDFIGVDAPCGGPPFSNTLLSAQSNQLRLDLFRINPKILDGLFDELRLDKPLGRQRVKRADDGGFGVHFKEAPEPPPGVTAAKTVRPQREQSARNPRRNLVGHGADIVRNGHKCPLLFCQQFFDVGFLRRPGRMQHVPALAANGVGAEQFVAGRAPNIGGDAVAFSQDFLRLQRGLNDRPAAKDVGFYWERWRPAGAPTRGRIVRSPFENSRDVKRGLRFRRPL